MSSQREKFENIRDASLGLRYHGLSGGQFKDLPCLQQPSQLLMKI